MFGLALRLLTREFTIGRRSKPGFLGTSLDAQASDAWHANELVARVYFFVTIAVSSGWPATGVNTENCSGSFGTRRLMSRRLPGLQCVRASWRAYPCMRL